MTEMNRAELLASAVAGLDLEADQATTAEALLSHTTMVVPDADWVSLTVQVRGGGYETLAFTAVQAERVDALQYELREGPCLDAISEAEWYRSGSVPTDGRWPAWGPRAASLGVGSLLAVQLPASGAAFGALNMYARREGRFADRDEIEFAVLYGAHVAIALTATRQVGTLRSAIRSRHSIGLAQGILMEKFDLSVEQSFAVLRRYSSTLNMKLADVAGDVVASRGLPVDDVIEPQ